MSVYDTLNDKQKEAVFHTEGPLLVLAGAGSGKDTRADTSHCLSYGRKGGKAMEYSWRSRLPIRQPVRCVSVWIS